MRSSAIAIGFAATLLCAGASHAQSPASNYPTKPVTLIAPFPPGTTTEFSAREISQIYTESLGRPFLVDFKAGAGGLIGHTYVAKSSPDGYTLLVLGGSFTTLPAFEERLPYDPIKGFDPISLFTKRSVLLVVTPSSTIKTFPDFLAYARANPGKINMGTSGVGSSFHLFGSLLASATGTQLTFIHYKGNAANYIDLVAGRIEASPMTVYASLPFVKGGKVRPIALLATQRSSFMPDLPTVAEMGVDGVDCLVWIGLAAPAGTPKDILARLNRPLAAYAASKEGQARAASQGDELVGSPPDVLARLISTEIAAWKKVVTENKIKPE